MSNYELKQIVLYVDNISVGYEEGKPILKNVTMVEKDVVRSGVESTGQIIAVVGRSGRGKSTLFKALTGLSKPSVGRVLITNNEDSNQPESAKEVTEGMVGFVDQKYTLFRHKTVFQILMYALNMSKVRKNQSNDEKIKIINDELVKWGLFEHKDKYPCELSGGQRQRTAIIEQLLTSKHFMVFDEPFSGLDVGNIESVKESFDLVLKTNELNTIIFSTHDIELAVSLSDVVYVIGHPQGDTSYSTVVNKYDLKEMDLAWTKFGQEHVNLVEQIKQDILKS